MLSYAFAVNLDVFLRRLAYQAVAVDITAGLACAGLCFFCLLQRFLAFHFDGCATGEWYGGHCGDGEAFEHAERTAIRTSL